MDTKKYSITRKENGTVIYEVDGALYSDLAQVPDRSDRAMLAAMDDGSFEGDGREPGTAGTGPGDIAADTARTRMIFLCVFGSIAVLMIIVAAISASDAMSQVNREIQAPGRVVDTVVRQEAGADSGTTAYSYPVVTFMDQSGKGHTVQVSEGSSPPEWSVGDSVTVRYDPEHPQNARIESLTSDLLLWLLPGVTGIVGIGFLLALFVVLWIMPAQPGG